MGCHPAFELVRGAGVLFVDVLAISCGFATVAEELTPERCALVPGLSGILLPTSMRSAPSTPTTINTHPTGTRICPTV
jgi:hypothetical protein